MPRTRDRPAALVPTIPSASDEADAPDADPVIRLVEGWLDDESGYDEAAWPDVKAALERERAAVAARPLFAPGG